MSMSEKQQLAIGGAIGLVAGALLSSGAIKLLQGWNALAGTVFPSACLTGATPTAIVVVVTSALVGWGVWNFRDMLSFDTFWKPGAVAIVLSAVIAFDYAHGCF